jgi:GNAT superfamily N-acetyltransferase
VIRVLPVDEALTRLDELADVLVDVVESGASVNFLLPLALDEAAAFWRGLLDGPGRVLLVAENDGRIDGTVMLVLAPQPNQAFRADVAKLLVHRRAQRQGLGASLMAAAEEQALLHDRTLLTLDTRSDSAGERLYVRQGWVKLGEIPHFSTSVDGLSREAASFFYKHLT